MNFRKATKKDKLSYEHASFKFMSYTKCALDIAPFNDDFVSGA